MAEEKATGKTKKRKKIPLNKDELKKILDKYEFHPDFIPNIKKLLKKNTSIHTLKDQKMKAR